MLISVHLSDVSSPIYQLDLEDGYDTEAIIETDLIDKREESKGSIEGRILHMPGVLLADKKISSKTDQELSISISGDHFIYNLVAYDGVPEMGLPRSRSAISSGMQQTIASTRQIDILVPAGYYSRRVFLVVSSAYMGALLQHEPWDVKSFLANTTSGYNNDVSVRSILNELTGDFDNGLYRRSFFELKLKEFFLRLHEYDGEIFPAHNIHVEDKLRLRAARDYLASDFVRPPTIPELSRIVSLNEFKLKRYFKLIFEETIHGFVIRLRMEKAEGMLLRSYSVAEVSDSIGYKSVSHFIVAFKKYYGKTPKQLLKIRTI